MQKVLLTLLLSAGALSILSPTYAASGKLVEISSKQIETFLPRSPDQKKFVELEFLGGLELSTKDDGFGGLSGIRMLNANRFIAITDKGKWLTGEIAREQDKPIALKKTRMGRLRDHSGKKLKGKQNADSEGIEIDGDTVLISFERQHRVERFEFQNDRLQAVDKDPIFTLEDIEIGDNKGQEGIALGPNASQIEGAILTFPELAFNDEGNLRAFMFKDGKRDAFSIVPANAFSLTDAAFLPSGSLLILERRFSFLTGMAMRLRMFKTDQIRPGAILAGSVILVANSDYEIDNMEGLAVSEMKDGSTRLTIISDDNFSKRQRTLLLEFKLPKQIAQ